MGVKETRDELVEKMNNDPSHLGSLDAVFAFELSGDDGANFQLKIADGAAEVVDQGQNEPTITLGMSDKNFIKLAKSSLNPTMAYMSGKLKVKGDLTLALKLNSIIQKYN